jgi:Helix-turn-helix domain
VLLKVAKCKKPLGASGFAYMHISLQGHEMDPEIVRAIWFDCPDLSDTAHKLLLALAYHCHHSPSCYPSVRRLSQMIRRSTRQTRSLLHQLEKAGYISISVHRGRRKSNAYTINRKLIPPVLPQNGKSMPLIFPKIGNPDCRSKSEVQTSPELEREEEREKTRAREEEIAKKAKSKEFLEYLGAKPDGVFSHSSLNGH